MNRPAARCSAWRCSMTSADRLAELSEHGVSVWLDSLSRGRLPGGGLAALVRDHHVVGVTTNPTIFEQALADSSDYASQVQDLGLRGVSPEEAARSIIGYDVRWACDVLRPVFDRTGGADGRVSIEVDPRVAHDTAKTVAERHPARRPRHGQHDAGGDPDRGGRPCPDRHGHHSKQVGDRRAGRLVFGAIDELDPRSDCWATDAGIDGAGASAEEAATHVVPDRFQSDD
jgi:hypothetical protein